MAWNEPGNNGNNDNQDPWGGKKNEPPELEESIKKIVKWFNGLFGNKTATNNHNNNFNGPSRSVIGIFLILSVMIWSLLGLYTIESGKKGLELRFGKYVETSEPGLNWRALLIDKVIIVDVATQRSLEVGYRKENGNHITPVPEEALMLTADENIIDFRLAVQYQINDPVQYQFQINNPTDTLKQVTESALREVAGRNNMDFIITKGRTVLGIQIEKLMQQMLDDYKTGIIITSLNLQDGQAPDEVQDAFDDVIKAREDQQSLKNEAEVYANGLIPIARGEAARQLQEANAYRERVIAVANGESERFLKLLSAYEKAPKITRQRMYIETMEMVLARTGKIIMDIDQGNNLMLLPLDKLMSRPPKFSKEYRQPSILEQEQKSTPEILKYSNNNPLIISPRTRRTR